MDFGDERAYASDHLSQARRRIVGKASNQVRQLLD